MKLKILLFAVFAAGLGASLALADSGKHRDNGQGCQEVHLQGTLAAQSLTITVTRAEKSVLTVGSQATLALGAAGQTVRANVEACATGTGSALQLAVKSLELRPLKTVAAQTTGGTTTGQHGDKHGDGEHHKGVTTTTTAVTTTAPTTTSH